VPPGRRGQRTLRDRGRSRGGRAGLLIMHEELAFKIVAGAFLLLWIALEIINRIS